MDGEDIPLGSKSPKTTRQQSRFWSGNVICSKIRILLLILLILVLVVLVIVLAVLLGLASSTQGDDKDSRAKGPTSTSHPPLPTTPGTEPWWNVRLPREIVPFHYNVFLNITVDLPRFDGRVEIFVNVTRPSDVILVHNDNISISHVTVQDADTKEYMPIKEHFLFKKNAFYVIKLASDLNPGRYVIKMTYAAFFWADLRGPYRSTYKQPTGKKVNFAATQFQPVRARRAFPCFDEPALKATFNVTISHRPDYIALSNMPIYKTETINGQKLDYFEKSVVMPTYLVAFVVGDFEYVQILTKTGVKMRVYSRPSVLNQTSFAAMQGSSIMTFFEGYFSIKYNLPKADMIALPDFGPGAMENWGLITYREKYLLWDPSTSSEANKQQTTSIIAHELAHQWFGNIATMKWWDDLWLNEGFANYMQTVAMAAVQPTWDVENQFILSSYTRAISLDGFASSHPIKVNVNSPDEIYEIFDAISYSKGGSVLRMLQSFIGNQTFVSGLTRYLNKHAFSNGETDDLWDALSKESCARGKCVDVKHVMDTWTLQMGYPVVKVTKQDPSTYLVTQKHFLFDPDANVSDSKYKSPFNYTWVIPFTYITNSNQNITLHWMERGSILIKNVNSKWIKGNVGYYGFYLVNYDDGNWDALKNQLITNHKVMGASDRASLIFDAFTLARGGQLNYTKAFDMTSYIKSDSDYVTWEVLVNQLVYLQRVLSPTSPAYKNLMKYLVYQAQDLYDKLGFSDFGSHLDIYKRGFLLDIYCEAGVSSCINNATARFNSWMRNPKQNKIPPNLRLVVYYYGVANGGVDEWDFVYSQYQTTDSPYEKIDLMRAMAASKESWILTRYLQYSLDPDKFKTSVMRNIFNLVAQTSRGNRIAWDFVRLNWDKFLKIYASEIRAYSRLIPGIVKYFTSDFELNELVQFNRELSQRTGQESSKMRQTVEEVKSNINWVKNNQKTIENWLNEFISSHKI